MNHTEMNWLDLRTGGANFANINTVSSISPGAKFTLDWHLNAGYIQRSANGINSGGTTPIWYQFLFPAIITPRNPVHCTNPFAPPGTVCFDINQTMITRWCRFSFIYKVVQNDHNSSPPMSLPRFGLSAMPYNAPAGKFTPDISGFAALYSNEITQPLNTRIDSLFYRTPALGYPTGDYVPGPETAWSTIWDKIVGACYRIDMLVTHHGDLNAGTSLIGVDVNFTLLPSIDPAHWNLGLPNNGDCPPAGTPPVTTFNLGYWCLCSNPFGFPQLRLLYQFAGLHNDAIVDHLVAFRRVRCTHMV